MGQLKHYSLYVNGPPAIAKAIDRPALPPLMLMRERIASTIIMFKGQETGGSSREKTVKAKSLYCLTNSAGVAGRTWMKTTGSLPNRPR